MADPWPALVDHHCHGVVTTDLDRAAFESLMNEATGPGPLGGTLFDSMLGVAIRRWCAPLLGLEQFAEPAAYIARRAALGSQEVNARFLQAADVSDFVVDSGFDPDLVTSPERTAAYAGGNGHEIIRLERIGEQALTNGARDGTFGERVRERLTDGGAIGAKSIAAYRVGLALPPQQPTTDQLVTALRTVEPGTDGTFRIAHPVLNSWLAYEAIDVGLPLQIHCGYGDNDLDLADCDPLLLTCFLRATEDRRIPVTLLHNYPYHRQAGYLAQVFGHVFMDVGLATHNSGALSRTILRESLELVPFAKMLYSSDAFGLGEFYYLGSLLFRRGLSHVLDGLVDDGELAGSDAEHITMLIARDNARRVYGLRGSTSATGRR
ncbi:MAG: amidohydrolase family protein [Nocardioidaceae bacterium]